MLIGVPGCQNPYRLRLTALHGIAQRTDAVSVSHVYIDSVLQQTFYDVRVSVIRRAMQSAVTVVVDGVDVNFGLLQNDVYCVDLVERNRRGQDVDTAIVTRIGICSALQRFLNGRFVRRRVRGCSLGCLRHCSLHDDPIARTSH